MPETLRRIPWPVVDPQNPDALVTREWLVTNGLGGYASGTVAGVVTRRYHGLLIAAPVVPLGGPYEFRAVGTDFEIALKDSGLPPLRLKLCSTDATFTLKGKRIENILYPIEESRGYQARGDLWSPGYFRFALEAGRRVTLVASTESFETMCVHEPEQALEAERGRRRRLLAQA